MTSRHVLGLVALTLLLVTACGGSGSSGDTGPRDESPAPGSVGRELPFRVIASEKTWPPNFFEIAQDDVAVRIAADQKVFRELWGTFGLQAEPGTPEPSWDQSVALFLAVGESSSCPLTVKGVRFDAASRRLIVRVGLQRELGEGEACTADLGPRTFVLEVPRSLLHEDWQEVQVVGVSRNPVIPIS
ncbi:MAG: hypothetical protein LOD90_08785 [Symbiobacteriaceae bacterium]|nr:MAG: hypothetical protein DIU69_10005 [Bacillota bacterium]